jgi:sec-independent protein translocase protein TatA
MFGTLGGPELFLILIVALIVFGPRKLPEMGKSLGKMMAEFRKASNEFQRTIEEEVEADRVKASAPASQLAPAPTPEAAAPAEAVPPPDTVERGAATPTDPK